VQIMLNVHQKGHGVCGTYPKEIAEAKVISVHQKAQESSYPLKAVVEEA